MATSSVFSSRRTQVRQADTKNAAGGAAYTLGVKEALARYAVTNTFGGTFYASAENQLRDLQNMITQVDDEFIAALAVYSRKAAHMKDMPAFLLSALSVRSPSLLKAVFPLVADNAKMVKNFVQILRSGTTGRRSLGTVPKRLVQRWLRDRTSQQLINDSVGGNPSLVDLLKMVHPRPADKHQEALFGVLLGRQVESEALPAEWHALKAFHRGETNTPPNVSFQLLTGQPLENAQWTEIAKNAPWQMTRINLNTFLRHGVFDSPDMVRMVAQRLSSAEQIRKARVLPYQLLSAYANVDDGMPRAIVSALHDAMEIACENVPSWPGKKLVIAVDVSGSMKNSVTGSRAGATSKVRCVDAAALMASALLRKNPDAHIVCFEGRVRTCHLEPRDTVMTNAMKMAALAGGSTECGVAMSLIQDKYPDADLVVFVSDNESWSQYGHQSRFQSSGTALSTQWASYRRKNASAKMVLLDVTPTMDSQNYTQDRVLNIAGFSDAVFAALDGFLMHDANGEGYWEGVIHASYQEIIRRTESSRTEDEVES